MGHIASRAFRVVNLKEFRDTGIPENLGKVELSCPYDRQYILRMPVRAEHGEILIPEELSWILPMFQAAANHQSKLCLNHPFVYITVRHGEVTSVADDEWHADGFSMKIPHIPEQNYIWCSHTGTEYVPLNVDFPEDFNPMEHNVHRYLENFVDGNKISTCEPHNVYCLDPYLLHRRPTATGGNMRTFVRISFVPIEINDVNNTQNPAMFRHYSQDGVQIRDNLKEYISI